MKPLAENIHMVSFTVAIPNKDKTGIIDTVDIKVPCEYDFELHEWLLTSEACRKIDNTKLSYMYLHDSITKEEYEALWLKLKLNLTDLDK